MYKKNCFFCGPRWIYLWFLAAFTFLANFQRKNVWLAFLTSWVIDMYKKTVALAGNVYICDFLAAFTFLANFQCILPCKTRSAMLLSWPAVAYLWCLGRIFLTSWVIGMYKKSVAVARNESTWQERFSFGMKKENQGRKDQDNPGYRPLGHTWHGNIYGAHRLLHNQTNKTYLTRVSLGYINKGFNAISVCKNTSGESSGFLVWL